MPKRQALAPWYQRYIYFYSERASLLIATIVSLPEQFTCLQYTLDSVTPDSNLYIFNFSNSCINSSDIFSLTHLTLGFLKNSGTQNRNLASSMNRFRGPTSAASSKATSQTLCQKCLKKDKSDCPPPAF